MKVYIVTRGEYSDYGIEAVFVDRHEAEKYCATHEDNYPYDPPMIEVYDTDDNSKIECSNVYKAFKFSINPRGVINIGEMYTKYSTEPIQQEIKFIQQTNTYMGYIPFTGDFDKEKFKKIVSDEVAKFKAQENGL